MLFLEEIFLEVHEDEGTRSDFEITKDKKDDLEHGFVSSEDKSKLPDESTLDSISKNSIVLHGSTLIGADERILLEILAMMV